MTYGTLNVDQVTNSDGVTSGGLYGFKNRIINGAMVINQRAGGTVTIPAATTYITDRFAISSTTASKLTAAQSSVAPTGFTNSLLVSVGTSFSTGTSDDFSIKQSIEGYNVSDFGFGASGALTITLSFWVYSSITGTYSFSLRNGSVNRSYVTTYTINAANTWEQKTITITGDTTGTWAKDNTAGMYLTWDLGQGTNYNTSTTNAWQAGNYNRTSGSVSFVSQANGSTFYITGVQLEKGSTATSFDYRPYGTELNLCQRYYQLGIACEAVAQTTSSLNGRIQLIQQMRSTPSLSKFGGDFSFGDMVAIGYQSSSSPTISTYDYQTLGVAFNLAGFPASLVTYRVYRHEPSGVINGIFAMSAEL